MSRLQTSSGRNTTRQMLDDLDVLMERMLALPMEEAEVSLSAPPEPIKRPTLAATLTLLPPPEIETKSQHSSVLQGPHLTFTVTDIEPTELASKPVPKPALAEPEVPPPLVIRRIDTEETTEPSPPVRTSSTLWRPLLWINQGFDQATRLLGPLGSILRSSGGRWLLGIAGLVLLGLAGACFLRDAMAWTR